MKIVKKYALINFENFVTKIFVTCELFQKQLNEQIIFFFNFIINSIVIIYKCLDISDVENDKNNVENLNLLYIFHFLTNFFTADMYGIMKDIGNHQMTNDKIINLKESIKNVLNIQSINNSLKEYSGYIEYLKYVDYIARFQSLCQFFIKSIIYFLQLKIEITQITKENISKLSTILQQRLDLSYSEIKLEIYTKIKERLPSIPRPKKCDVAKIATSSESFLKWLTINEIPIPETNEEINKIINDLDCNTNFIDRNQNEGLTRLDVYNYIAFLFTESPLDLLIIRKFINSLLICQKLPLISSYGSWIRSKDTKDNIARIIGFLNDLNSTLDIAQKKNFIEMLFMYIYTNPSFHDYKGFFDLDLCNQIIPDRTFKSVDLYISFIKGGGYLRYIAKNRGKYKKYNKSRKLMKNHNKKLHLNVSIKRIKKKFKKKINY